MKGMILMINLTTIVQIGGLWLLAMYLNYKYEVLEEENEGLRDRIKRDAEWHETDKKVSIDLAIVNEKLRVSHEEYIKNNKRFQERLEEIENEEYRNKCEEFQKTCEEFHKQCEAKA
jgi:predicted nuclease with TOPRIM domain